MRDYALLFLALLTIPASLRAADTVPVSEQKKKAEERWAIVEAGPFAQHETKHLLLYAPEAMAGQLRDLGTLLEKHLTLAEETVQYREKEEELPGKVTVYLLASREQFASFVRRVEKRRLQARETGTVMAADDWLHVAVCPPADRKGPSVEAQAGQHVAMLILLRRAGVMTPLPDWLVSGFGRATYYHAVPQAPAVREERRQAARLSHKYAPPDIWAGTPDSGDLGPLEGSLVDFLAYGPGSTRFMKLVLGFQPEENGKEKTMEQALEAAGLKADRISSSWKRWVVSR